MDVTRLKRFSTRLSATSIAQLGISVWVRTHYAVLTGKVMVTMSRGYDRMLGNLA